jgi:hypothetical protein
MAYDRLLGTGDFCFLSISLNIINLFNQSDALAKCVGVGWADKLFDKIGFERK